ncbi:MAG: ATP-binding protein, partial [Syntrophomonadaceae bacterium]|nr:ATP-binding protein [Syntrophomonadaceae bacterium]
CDLNRAVREALALLGSQMAARGIRVSTRLDHQLPEVMGNERGMEEIAINLLVNAMQAFDESTRTEREVVITTRREGGWVVMEVADNATGIEEEAKEHLFEPFTTTKLHSEGMGLGLTIVQSIVSGSGGNVDVRNNEWGGATFRIELPALGPEKE